MRDINEQVQKSTWEEQYPDAAELCKQGLEQLRDNGERDPKGLELLKKSADSGYPWGQYKYAISCFYQLEDFKSAHRYFKKAASAGHLDSLYHLGVLYQKRLAVPGRLSKDPCVAEVQLQREAAKIYQSAADLGHWRAQLSLGLMYLDGFGVCRNYRKAFQLIKSSAWQNYPPAMARLARLHLDDRKLWNNPLEAYIWALLEANGEGTQIAEEIEPRLSLAEVCAAQEEVARRQEILWDKGCLTEADLAAFTPAKETTPARAETMDPLDIPPQPEDDTVERQQDPSSQGKCAKKRALKISVPGIGDLSLTFYLKSGKITLSAGGEKHTLPAASLLSDNCLALLIKYDKHVRFGEPAVQYNSSDLVDARKNSRRKNHQVVADFNYSLRKVLGLPKQDKPFEWLGDRFHRDLKANFILRIVY